MDLLDYQKSGNSYGVEITPYPPYSLLAGKIPKVPGIANLPGNIGMLFEYNPDYAEAIYASKFFYVTSNSLMQDEKRGDIISVLEQGSFKIIPRNTILKMDPFMQSIGSIPLLVRKTGLLSLRNAWNPEGGGVIENLSYSVPHKDQMVDIYKAGLFYNLPLNYRGYSAGTIEKKRFTTRSESPYGVHAGADGPEGNEIYYYLPHKTLYESGDLGPGTPAAVDKVGYDLDLKVFDFKKEQYVSIIGSIEQPYTIFEKPEEFQDDVYVATVDVEKTRKNKGKFFLNFISLFTDLKTKREGFIYSVSNLPFVSDASPVQFRMMTFDSFKSTFHYDRVAEYELKAKGEDFGKPVSFYENGLIGKDSLEKLQEIRSIAYQSFERIEQNIYEDCSYDIENSIQGKGFFKDVNMTVVNAGDASSLEPFYKTVSFKYGLPQKEGVAPFDTNKHRMFANVNSKYNFLHAIAEKGFNNLHEVDLPNIYTHIKELKEQGGASALTIDNLYDKHGKQGILCPPLEKAAGKNKILYFGSKTQLDAAQPFKEALPFYNEVTFDILANANREACMILKKTGILKDFLYSILTLSFGPQANLEMAKSIFAYGGSSNADSLLNIQSAEQRLAEAVMAASKYYVERKSPEARISETPDVTDLPIEDKPVMYRKDTDQLRFLFEDFFQYYIDFIHKEGVINGNIIDKPLYNGQNVIEPNNFTPYYTEYEHSLAQPTPSELSQFNIGGIVDAIAKLKKLFADKMRRLEDISSDKFAPSYSEPLMYMIEKTSHGMPIQRIFIPHFNNFLETEPDESDATDDNIFDSLDDGIENLDITPVIKKMKFVDTQVKYGKVYKYKIYQMRLVVGSQHRYVFSTTKHTDYIASNLGYGMKRDDDVIMRAGRLNYPDGPMMYDAVNPPTTTIPGSFQPIPFQLYSKTDPQKAAQVLSKPNPMGEFEFGTPSGKTYDEIPSEEMLAGTENPPMNQDKMAIFKSIIYPKITIEIAPYYEQMSVITDFPPLPPNVNFDPLIGKGSKMLITFEHQTGDVVQHPIYITPRDKTLYGIIRETQDIPWGIRFKSDDFPKAYEVFRLTTPPRSYGDFSGNLIRTINVEEKTGYIEDFVPNVTYYYLFRSVDIHNSPSFPSAIYSVTMVFDSGVYYPIINQYHIEKKDAGYNKKEFKQYLKIDASLLQKIVNKKKSGVTRETSVSSEKPVLGIVDGSIWNEKKFKFRITSKHTGKMVDLNVNFKTNHTDPEEPVQGC